MHVLGLITASHQLFMHALTRNNASRQAIHGNQIIGMGIQFTHGASHQVVHVCAN